MNLWQKEDLNWQLQLPKICFYSKLKSPINYLWFVFHSSRMINIALEPLSSSHSAGKSPIIWKPLIMNQMRKAKKFTHSYLFHQLHKMKDLTLCQYFTPKTSKWKSEHNNRQLMSRKMILILISGKKSKWISTFKNLFSNLICLLFLFNNIKTFLQFFFIFTYFAPRYR